MPKRIGILLLLICGLFLIGCGDNNKNEKVIATVNGSEITQGEFNEYFAMMKNAYELHSGHIINDKEDKELIAELKDEAFEEVILQTIIMQEAEKKKIGIPDSEVEEELQMYKTINGEDGFKDYLKELGITEEQLKKYIKQDKVDTALRELITADIEISQEEIKEYYENNPDAYNEPAGIEIAHILVETEAEAADIIAELKEGADFAELAANYSSCPSKAEGGDLGIVNETSSLVPEFKDAALRLESNEITKTPVKSEFGYHVIKAGNKVAAVTKSLEEVEVDISYYLLDRSKNERYYNYVMDLRAKATIEDKR
ncbi:MAG: hypothetical protein GX333_08205 [Syntrophomonadaceae bacterium]|nr:hypothetical protein [Syntrophomonadaceae bacterium]